MSDNDSSPMLTPQDPMLVSSSPRQDEPTSLNNRDVDKLESDTEISLEECSEPTVVFTIELDKTGERDVYEISSALNRIYTSTDRSITFDIVCSPNPNFNPKGDNTTFNEHVVRHKDALAEYVGTATGKLFRERLAILVPLDESGRKSISLDFVCLNSCHKIRKLKLALVFTLENPESGKILARKVFNIQISKNFKRDMEVAEKGRPVKRPPPEPPEPDCEPAPKRALLTAQPSPSQGTTTQPDEPRVEVKLDLMLPRAVAQDYLNYSRQFFQAKLYQAPEHVERELLPVLAEIRKKSDALSDTKKDENKD